MTTKRMNMVNERRARKSNLLDAVLSETGSKLGIQLKEMKP